MVGTSRDLSVLAWKNSFCDFYLELFPAIRCNLLLFKEKSKRISTSNEVHWTPL